MYQSPYNLMLLLCHFLEGIRLFLEEKATDDLECKALSYKTHHIDIYSNSWGPDDRGFHVTGPGPLTQRALKNGAEKVTNTVQ